MAVSLIRQKGGKGGEVGGLVEGLEKALSFKDSNFNTPGDPNYVLREGPRRFSQREFEGGAPESNQAQTGENYIPVYLDKYRNTWFYSFYREIR